MLLAHDPEGVDRLRTPTVDDPLRLLSSACMLGEPVGVDGTDYGFGGAIAPLTNLPTVQVFGFCPEDVGLGTPRTMPDIHGGDGFDVLKGTARVLDEHGKDLTTGMIEGAQKMAAFAVEKQIEVAVLMDMSGACGSQVISDGCRFDEERKYRAGVGVATAALVNAGINVIAQRDFASMERLMKKCGAEIELTPGRTDHHQTAWFQEYFGE